MDIGVRIKEIRLKQKKTQIEFSQEFGIDNSQYSKIENGKLDPTLKFIMEICSKYSISSDSLLFGNTKQIAESLYEKELTDEELRRELLCDEKLRLRIKEVIKHIGVKDIHFAEKIGVKQNTLSQQLEGKRSISMEVVFGVISSLPNINSNWLITGNGSIEHVDDRDNNENGIHVSKYVAVLEENIQLRKEIDTLKSRNGNCNGISNSTFSKENKIL